MWAFADFLFAFTLAFLFAFALAFAFRFEFAFAFMWLGVRHPLIATAATGLMNY